MGIKDHKKLLINYNLLKLKGLESKKISESIILIDYMTLVMKTLFTFDDISECVKSIKKYIKRFKNNKIYIFVDRGHIAIKEIVREKREKNLNSQITNMKEKAENIKKDEKLPESVKEIEIEDISRKIKKYSNIKFNKERVIEDTLNIFETMANIKIIYTDNEDAEFYMCRKIGIIRKKNKYDGNIYIVTCDQDVLMFCIENYDKIVIIDNFITFNYERNNITMNLSKLNLLFNSSDYFPGILRLVIKKNFNIEYLDITVDNTVTDTIFLIGIYVFNTIKNSDPKCSNDKKTIADILLEYIEDIIEYCGMKKTFYKKQYVEKLYTSVRLDVKDMIVFLKNYLSFESIQDILKIDIVKKNNAKIEYIDDMYIKILNIHFKIDGKIFPITKKETI